MDCFYAAVEMREHPEYRDIPIAIGGDKVRRGVLCTCNYPARKYGVKSAMPTAHALRLCPELLVLPGSMDLYKEVSRQILSILRRYSRIIEPLSLDEAYLDVSHSQQFWGSATLIAEDIRRTIESELNLTASAGVAPNKFLAKIASDENKPNGLCVITPEQATEFAANLPLRKIPGIGQVTEQRLKKHDLLVGADLLSWSENALLNTFGKMGQVLYWRCRGLDNRELVTCRMPKSIGVEVTLEQDIHKKAECYKVISQLFPKLVKRCQGQTKANKIARLGVKLKFSDFVQTSAEKKCIVSVAHVDETLLYVEKSFYSLLDIAFSRSEGRAIRLVGLQLGLEDNSHKNPLSNSQLSLDL